MSGAQVLVVCSANVCRSPMAAALLTRWFGVMNVASVVKSAGTAVTHLGVDPVAVAVMREMSLDIRAHVPRRMSAQMLDNAGADLVLTMTGAHLREVVVANPGAWERSFTMRDLATRACVRPGLPGEAVGAWLARVGADRVRSDLLRPDPRDDIADPYGAGKAKVRRTAEELDELAHKVVRAWPRPSDPSR